MTSPSSMPALSSREPEVSFRPVSTLAVISVVVSLSSWSAFASPWLWGAPVVALLVSVYSIWTLERARREYAGQLLAKLAAALALAAAIGAPTRYGIERLLIVQEAHVVANTYLDLILANRPKEAFVWLLEPISRAGMEDQVDQLIVRAANQYRGFLESQEYTHLGGRGAVAQVTSLPHDRYSYFTGYYQVYMPYVVHLDDTNTDVDVGIWLRGGTAPDEEWEGRQWFITQVSAWPRPAAAPGPPSDKD